MLPKPTHQLHVLDDEPPIRIAKPWFAQGWVVGLIIASPVTVFALYKYGIGLPIWMILILILLWTLVLLKFLKGVRYVEFYSDAVLTYGLNPSKPVSQIPYERMTVVLDINEVFFIPKAKFTGGFSLKKVYWKHNWEQLKTIFTNNAGYVMRNYVQKPRPGADPSPIPMAFPGGRTRNRGFGIFGALVMLYELLVGMVLWLPYELTKPKKTD